MYKLVGSIPAHVRTLGMALIPFCQVLSKSKDQVSRGSRVMCEVEFYLDRSSISHSLMRILIPVNSCNATGVESNSTLIQEYVSLSVRESKIARVKETFELLRFKLWRLHCTIMIQYSEFCPVVAHVPFNSSNRQLSFFKFCGLLENKQITPLFESTG